MTMWPFGSQSKKKRSLSILDDDAPARSEARSRSATSRPAKPKKKAAGVKQPRPLKRGLAQIDPDIVDDPRGLRSSAVPSSKRSKTLARVPSLNTQAVARGRPQKAYQRTDDMTLTKAQIERGFATPEHFRDYSNPTLRGYSTGYHESAVTTDTFNYLSSAKTSSSGMVKLPTPKASSFFADSRLAHQEVSATTVAVMKAVADGFRTDTAQTILSSAKGIAAGHSGSEVTLSGQSTGHDLLRSSIEGMLLPNPKARGLSPRSVAVAFGAITVASMAPGAVARSVDTAALKAGDIAKQQWEQNRNKAKSRVQLAFDGLSPDEQRFVLDHTAKYLASTQEGSGAVRALISGRPVTPRRSVARNLSRPNDVAGGDYLFDSLDEADIAPPLDPGELGFYFTQPFRAPRRSLLPD